MRAAVSDGQPALRCLRARYGRRLTAHLLMAVNKHEGPAVIRAMGMSPACALETGKRRLDHASRSG